MRFSHLLVLCTATTTLAGPVAHIERSRLQPRSVSINKAGKFLVETGPGVTKWVTEQDKLRMLENDIGFLDITDSQEGWERLMPTNDNAISRVAIQSKSSRGTNYPTLMMQKARIRAAIEKLQTEPMKDNLVQFTSFNNRYYKSRTGIQSSQWLLARIQETVSRSGATHAKVTTFKHRWPQDSIIVTIPGKSAKTVVIGSHQDSINLRNPMNGLAPGADDNGSGTVTILEAMRVMLQDKDIRTGRQPNTIEFHWYAGEEVGLLGSQDIFQSYRTANRDIRAMLNQDMTGYVSSPTRPGEREALGVVTDFVDPELTKYISRIIQEYCRIPAVMTRCSYACSDHASARKAGYPSAFVIESEDSLTNPFIHTPQDTVNRLSWTHMLEHAKLTLGWAMELAFFDL